MGSFKLSCLVAASILAFISASPCPRGQLAERGELPAHEAGEFFKVHADGESEAKHMMDSLQESEIEGRQLGGIIGGLVGGLLPMGGGLLNGVLQPLTGVLKNLGSKRHSLATVKLTSSYIS